jgi:hypothetical protein
MTGVKLSPVTVAIQAVVSLVICAPALFHFGLALPGASGGADLPGTVNLHWLVAKDGLAGLTRSTALMYPAEIDRIVLDGFPLDGLISWPFTAVLGWPGGFTVFVALCLFSMGCASAWMAKIWWSSPVAAAVAGLVAQCNPFLIREIADGRVTQLFGAIFLPLTLVFLWRCIKSTSPKHAVIAGLMMGLGTLAYWYYGVFFVLSGLLMLALARPLSLNIWGTVSIVGLAVVAVVAWPIAHTISSLNDVPGMATAWGDLVVHGGHQVSLTQILEHRDLGSSVVAGRVVAAQVLVLVLMVVGVASSERHQWIFPLFLGIMALLFAAGPNVSILGLFELPGPFRLFQSAPFLRRLWWPDRALVMLVPAVSLLVGGGGAALAARYRGIGDLKLSLGLCVVLLAEAFVVIPGLPMPTTWGGGTQASAVLSRGTGPVLILPMGSGSQQPDTRMLIDQVHHGRALVNGPMTPGVSAAPAVFSLFGQTPGMAALIACETTTSIPRSSPDYSAMSDVGINTVYLELSRAEAMPMGVSRYTDCVTALLGLPVSEEGPFQVYAVPY